MRRILIVGAGGHGQVVADILLAARRDGEDVLPAGFLDDDPALLGTSHLGLPVLGAVARWRELGHDALLVAIGDNAARRRLFLALREQGARFANAIHPAATLARDVRLGEGVVICAGAVVGTGSLVGDGVILNTASTADHHSRLGAFAHLAPGVHLGGNVTVGEGALLGIGSAVVPGCTVGDWAVVGARAAVIRGVPS
ncbi:MAG: acetyltransferase, partial [Anaerolineae bacterium]|nr:acetyltransferase [Anaerolineae bacterium]